MIREIEIRIDIGGQAKDFKGHDIDTIISEVDEYLVSQKG